MKPSVWQREQQTTHDKTTPCCSRPCSAGAEKGLGFPPGAQQETAETERLLASLGLGSLGSLGDGGLVFLGISGTQKGRHVKASSPSLISQSCRMKIP